MCLVFGVVCLCECGTQGGQKSPVALELELQAVVNCPVWVLGTKVPLSAIPGCAELEALNSSTGFFPGIPVP